MSKSNFSRAWKQITSSFYLSSDALISLVFAPSAPHILVACMPKSGSTYLATVLSKYEGFRAVNLVPAFQRREQELCEILLARYNHRGSYVAQHHIRNSEWTQQLIRQFRLSPVVLVRNLADVVVSLRDHIRREALSPMAFFTESHIASVDADLEETIVRLAIPWYLNFYASWRESSGALFVSYEDLIQNSEATIKCILEYANVPSDSIGIRRALDSCKTTEYRMNVGITGRGKLITPNTMQALRGLINQYPQFEGDAYFKSMRESFF
jgi:Sulfotransferase domain